MQTNFQSKYETVIKASISKVWDALTNPVVVKQYFFGSNLQTDWKVGEPILWTGEYEGKFYIDKGVVLEFEACRRLSYSYLSSWSGLVDEPKNYLLVKYEVKEKDGNTLLTIIQSNYDEEKATHTFENWATVVNGLKKIIE
jgi:uncharacterized protein YndB with AHSA1/START domain